MGVSASFRTYVLEQLGRVLPAVAARSMFGGLGIYSTGFFFALVDDDVLYFKVDASNRADYEAAGVGPFRPFGDTGGAMQYYEVPGDVLDDAERLGGWARKALRVAQAKRRKRR